MVGGRWQILVSVEDGSAGAGAEEGSDFEPGSRLARLKGAGENYLLRARGYGPRIRLYFPVVLSCSNLTIHGSRPSAYGLQGVVQLKSQNPVKKKKKQPVVAVFRVGLRLRILQLHMRTPNTCMCCATQAMCPSKV